jgi:hypothetical protein
MKCSPESNLESKRRNGRVADGHDDRPAENRVMSFRQWCQLNGFSYATGRRILASADGPIVLQLSANRIGIRHSDNLRWQEECALRRSGEAA